MLRPLLSAAALTAGALATTAQRPPDCHYPLDIGNGHGLGCALDLALGNAREVTDRHGWDRGAIDIANGSLSRPNQNGVLGDAHTVILDVYLERANATYTGFFDGRSNRGFGEGFTARYNHADQAIEYGTSGDLSVFPAALPLGTWASIGFARDPAAGEYRVYVDGVEVDATTRAFDPVEFTDPGTALLIGDLRAGSNSSVPYHFRGRMGDVRFYEEAIEDIRIAAATDITDPNKPASMTVSAVTDESVLLTWPPATDNLAVDYYSIGVIFGNDGYNINVRDTSVVVSGLTSGARYQFINRSADYNGNTSGPAAVATATVDGAPDTEAPSATTLMVDSVATHSIALRWAPATDNAAVARYTLRYNGSDYAVGRVTAFTLPGLAGDTAYEISVRAEDGAGNLGPWSPAVTASTAGLPLAEDLVHYVSFDGGAYVDSIGGGSVRGMFNARFTRDRFGESGEAFQAGSGYALLENLGSSFTDAFSVSLWAKPIADQPANRNEHYLLDSRHGNGGGNGIFVRLDDAAGELQFGNNRGYVSAPFSYTGEAWTHLAFTHDEATQTRQIFIDGQLASGPGQAFHTNVLGSFPANSFLNIGTAAINDPSWAAVGLYDEVRIHDRAIGLGNVAELYAERDTEAPVVPGDLVVDEVTETSARISFQQPTDDNRLFSNMIVINGVAQRPMLLTDTYTGLTPDTEYTVVVRPRDYQGNVGSSNLVTFRTAGSSSVDGALSPPGFRLSPNPTRGGRVRLGALPEDAVVSVVGLRGRELVTLPGGQRSFSTAEFAPGLYIVRVLVPGGGAAARRLIVE